MPEHLVSLLAKSVDHAPCMNLLSIDFSSLPIKARLEQVVLQET
jgi:hypothetical protein